MEIFGFIASVLMGLSLGLIGGGGSILTVPILVYLFHVTPLLSTSYSLFVVGVTSLIGSYAHYRERNVDFKTAVVFGLPSVISVWAVRRYLVPVIPENMFTLGDLQVTKDIFVLSLFAVLMVLASLSMIRNTNASAVETKNRRPNWFLILLEGVVIGGITGMVGAGGGFLIIPALALLGGLSMKKAVGTSLLIIGVKSLMGFVGDLSSNLPMDFTFMLLFSSFAVAGILAGSVISKHISDSKLKPVFGWFVLAMGLFMLTQQVLFHT